MNRDRAKRLTDGNDLVDNECPEFNLARRFEEKLASPDREARVAQWLAENREAIQAYNERIARDGPVCQDWNSI